MKEPQSQGPFAYLKFFVMFVAILLVASFILRIGFMMVESKFQDPSFYVLTQFDGRPYVVHFDTNSRKIYSVEMSLKVFFKGKKLKTSLESGMPIDAFVQGKRLEDIVSIPSIIMYVLAPTGGSNINGVNAVDLFKLWMVTWQTNVSDKGTVNLSKNGENFTHQQAVYDALKDPGIVNEKVSVEIVNRSGVDGAGNKFAIMLKNIGVNVISISTKKEISKSVIINRSSGSKTINKLLHLLGFGYKESEAPGIADVTIELGKDIKKQL